jgi:hypothetical protein
MVNRCDLSKYTTARKLDQEILNNCRGILGQLLLYNDGEYSEACVQPHFPTMAHIEIANKVEVDRENVCNVGTYVEEMVSADQSPSSINIQKTQDDVHATVLRYPALQGCARAPSPWPPPDTYVDVGVLRREHEGVLGDVDAVELEDVLR